MDNKKIETINKICRLAQQDADFGEMLRKKLGANNVVSIDDLSDDRIDEIYEYCIEKIIHRQAEEFYQDFPIKAIVPVLIEDYVRMESFRRKDNFGDFCLSLYQQIEGICNRICSTKTMDEITQKMWGYPAFVESGENITPKLDVRKKKTGGTDYLVAHLIFFKSYAAEKSKKSLQSQGAADKMRIIVYFFGFKAMPTSSDYRSFTEITDLLFDIYQCRNTNHRGNTMTEREKMVLDRVLPMKSLYYFKFLGALAQFVEFVKTGTPYIEEIKKYTDTLTPKEVKPSMTVVGKIKLSEKDLNKKRF